MIGQLKRLSLLVLLFALGGFCLSADASTSPWQAAITEVKVNWNYHDACYVLDAKVTPGSGVTVLTCEYGASADAYTVSFEAGRTFPGGPTLIRIPVPWEAGSVYAWRVAATNTDPDGRGTSVAEKTGTTTAVAQKRYAWKSSVASGAWNDPANWYQTITTEAGYPATGGATFLPFGQDFPWPARYTVSLTEDATNSNITVTNMHCLAFDLGGNELRLTGFLNGVLTTYDSEVEIANGTLSVNRVFMRGPVASTVTVKDGGRLILNDFNWVSSNFDATTGDERQRITVERGGTLSISTSDPRQYYDSEKLDLDMRPGSIISGSGFQVGGSDETVGLTLDGVIFEGRATDSGTIALARNGELRVLNGEIDRRYGVDFGVGASATNAFLHLSNTVWNSTGVLKLGGTGNTFLIEDCLFPENGFGGISFPNQGNSRDNLMIFRNSVGVARGDIFIAVWNLTGYGNTLAFDNSRLYRTNSADNSSQTLFGSLNNSKDWTLLLCGANPVINDSYLHVGDTANFDADHMNTLRLEVPRAGWPEAPIQSGNTGTWKDGYFKVEVVLADGELDEDVDYIPIYESTKLTLNFKDSANPFSTWTIPEGTEVVYDTAAGTIGLAVTGATDRHARFATKGLDSHRYYGGLKGTIASLGPWGAATLKVRYGTVPYALDHEETIGTFTTESESLAFAYTLGSFPVPSKIFAQYVLETTDPESGRTYVTKTGLLRRMLTQANTSLSWAGATVDGNTVVPYVTLNPPGGGTTTLKCLILDVNDPSFTNVVDFGTYPEDCITNVATLKVTYAGLPVLLPKGTYKVRFVAENSFNGKTYTTTCDSVNFNVTTAGFLWKQDLAKGDWEAAANWVKIDPDCEEDYPCSTADVAYFSSYVPTTVTLASDITVKGVNLNLSQPVSLCLAANRVLTLTDVSTKTNGTLTVTDGSFSFCGGGTLWANKLVQKSTATDRFSELSVTNAELHLYSALELTGGSNLTWRVQKDGYLGLFEKGGDSTGLSHGMTVLVEGGTLYNRVNYYCGASDVLIDVADGLFKSGYFMKFDTGARNRIIVRDGALVMRPGLETRIAGTGNSVVISNAAWSENFPVDSGVSNRIELCNAILTNCTWSLTGTGGFLGVSGPSNDFISAGNIRLGGSDNTIRIDGGAVIPIKYAFSDFGAGDRFEIGEATVTNETTTVFATDAKPSAGGEIVIDGEAARLLCKGESQLGSEEKLEEQGRFRFVLTENRWTSAPVSLCTQTIQGAKKKKYIRKYIPITVERGAAPVGTGRNIPLIEWDDDPNNQITVTDETLNEVADLSTLPKGAMLFVCGNVIYVRMPSELGLSVIVR